MRPSNLWDRHRKQTDAANAQMGLLTKQMAAAQGITKDLKAGDQMTWVGAMNNIRSAVEEIILDDFIYA